MPSLHTGVDATKQGGFKRVDGLTPYIYDFSSMLEVTLGPDETFIWDLDFPD